MARPRVKGSVRDGGKVKTVAINKETKDTIDKLAEDAQKPISAWLRDTVRQLAAGKQPELIADGERVSKADLRHEMNEFREEFHKIAAVAMLTPFAPMLTGDGEFSKVGNNLAAGMEDVENIVARRLVALPGGAMAFWKAVIAKADRLAESKQLGFKEN